MAISLNAVNNTVSNHETRIKNLETKTTVTKLTPKLLWSGSASSGTVTVAEIANYNVFIVILAKGTIICDKSNESFIYDDMGDAAVSACGVTFSGSTFTVRKIRSDWWTQTVTKIIGIG